MDSGASKSHLLERCRNPIRFFILTLAVVTVLYPASTSPAVRLEVTLETEEGTSTPARILIRDESGNSVSSSEDALAVPGEALGIPEEAIAVMYGRQDVAEGYARQPDGSFYVDGSFSLELPAGRYQLEVSKGYEYRRFREQLLLEAGDNVKRKISLERWINMPARGWYSADDHIHLTRSPREDPLILRWMAAEDIHVGNLLQMGDFWTTYFSQYGFGRKGRYREGPYILSAGQEDPRTPEIGHTISLGADSFVRFPGSYYRYDRVFDAIHAAGGVTGYAHQGMSFHGYRGLSMDVPEGKIDFLELLQFCVEDGPLHLDHYYRFLDLGFPLTATAGSDFPWCGRGPRFGLEEGCSQIGDARFYTYIEGEFNFENWLASLRSGHTFVSSGPMLELTVNGAIPGDRLDLARGESLRIRARAYGESEQIPLENLEIIGHGRVLQASKAAGEERGQLEVELELTPDRGIWIAARCRAGKTQVAHTTPVYVSVGGTGFHNPLTAPGYLEETETYLQEIENEIQNPGGSLDHQITRHASSVHERIDRVRQVLDRLRRAFEMEP